MKTTFTDSPDSARRGFIHRLLATVGGLFAPAAAGKVTAQAPVPEENVPEQPQSRGYRETDHVRAYYRAARF
ncbi:MAG TPA: hypothetical protein VLU73_15710 [Methylococcaceae bacterium]|jgi:hypothetical protein|nr:hypothetical protein [Methylococcaceae bacterium]